MKSNLAFVGERLHKHKEVTGLCAEHLDFLITNASEKQLYYERFWREDCPNLSVLDFQKHKIITMSMTFSQFVIRLHNNDKEAIEQLAQQPVEDKIMEKIRERLADGTYTPETMYAKFKADVGINVARFTQKLREF